MTISAPGFTILTDIDHAHAGVAGEGRDDDLLVDEGLLLVDLGLRAFQIGRRSVERRLADGMHLILFLVARISDARQIGRRLQRFQAADIVARAQAHQHGAGLDIVAGIEIDFIDDAGNFRRKIGAADGLERAHGFDLRLPLLVFHRHGRNGRGRQEAARHEHRDHRAHEHFVAEDAAEQDADDDQHDDHPAPRWAAGGAAWRAYGGNAASAAAQPASANSEFFREVRSRS